MRGGAPLFCILTPPAERPGRGVVWLFRSFRFPNEHDGRHGTFLYRERRLAARNGGGIPNEETFHLDPDARHAVMMHDEFEMDLVEVAFTMEQSVRETAALLEQARTSLHQRQGAAPTEDDALAGSDAVDAPPGPEEGHGAKDG